MPSIGKLIGLARRPGIWGALRYGVAATVEHRRALARFSFADVVDVGANKGQFAVFAKDLWPLARLTCFEPLEPARSKLAALLGPDDRLFDCALGETEGRADMHVASRADSSSLRPLGEGQKTIFRMEEVAAQSVRIRRLDACLTRDDLRRPALLKIDVQGFEHEVVRGASGLLACFDVLYVEASFEVLYEGQALVGDIVRELSTQSFELAGIFNQEIAAGRPIQADFLFVRRSA